MPVSIRVLSDRLGTTANLDSAPLRDLSAAGTSVARKERISKWPPPTSVRQTRISCFSTPTFPVEANRSYLRQVRFGAPPDPVVLLTTSGGRTRFIAR